MALVELISLHLCARQAYQVCGLFSRYLLLLTQNKYPFTQIYICTQITHSYICYVCVSACIAIFIVVKEWNAATDLTANPACISSRHFAKAVEKVVRCIFSLLSLPLSLFLLQVQPSVSADDREKWSSVQKYMSNGVGAIQALRLSFHKR